METKTKKLCIAGILTAVAVAGGLCAYPIAILFMGTQAGEIAFYAYIIPFLVSTAGGAVISAGLLAVLKNTGLLAVR